MTYFLLRFCFKEKREKFISIEVPGQIYTRQLETCSSVELGKGGREGPSDASDTLGSCFTRLPVREAGPEMNQKENDATDDI